MPEEVLAPSPLGLDEEETTLLVGKGSQYYREQWEKGGFFNLAACFWGVLWFGFRKMYAYLFFSVGLFYGIDIALALNHIDLPEAYYLLINLAVGLIANHSYRRHLKQQARKLQTIPTEKRRDAIKRSGGTSWWGALGAIMLVLVYGYISDWTCQQLNPPHLDPETHYEAQP